MSETTISYETTDIEALRQEILSALPEEFRALGAVGLKATEQSYWVNDGRTTPHRAASLILEQLGCDRSLVA